MFYSFREDLRYAYSLGELRVRENKMLGQRDFSRLLSTANLEEMALILSEAGYKTPERAEEIFSNPDDFLSSNTAILYKRLKEIGHHPEIFNLFIIRYDFRNFGVLLKKEIAEGSLDDRVLKENFLINLGLQGLDKLQESFKKKNYEIYPENMAEIFSRIEKKIKKENPDKISQTLDREYFKLALEASSSNDFCRYIFNIFVDFANLESALRIKNIKRESKFGEFFIEGGKIAKNDFLEFLGGRLNLINLLSRYSYEKLFSPSPGEKEEALLGEKKLDDFLIEVLKEARFSFIGLEAVVAYLLVKELEMKNIRLILQGKKAGLTEEELRPDLRATYE